MGCCPSKHRATKSADLSTYNEYPPTERIDIDFTLSERATTSTQPEADDASTRAKVHEAPSTMLMDRGDGFAIEHSDHESNKDVRVIVVDEDNQNDHDTLTALSFRPPEKLTPTSQLTDSAATASSGAISPINIVVESHDVQPSLPPTALSPSRASAPTSPSKAPTNFDDIPINSMYHRIHMVKMEEQEAKRHHELQAEAERREREIQEFKAAMLAGRES